LYLCCKISRFAAKPLGIRFLHRYSDNKGVRRRFRMQDSFDVLDYVDFLRARWKFPALACGFAIVAALATGFLLPKRYTATATVLIDPPAGGDPRMATAVSTVYLESLKTYELLATNDQLFVRAAGRFQLGDHGGSPIESLKRRVLKVDKLRDTRALQISVTLPEPKTAQAVAQFIADGTVELNRSGSKEADQAMIEDAAKAAESAKSRLNEAEKAWQMAAGAYSEDALRSEISDDGDLKSRAEEQLLNEQASLAESENRQKRLVENGTQATEAKDQLEQVQRDIGASHARAELLERRIAELTRVRSEKSAALAQQSARAANLEAALTGARASYETAAQRLADLPVTLGSRTEWLRVVDPGIIPQRPSSPNVPLILIGAVSLALFGSLLYLTISFSLTRGRRAYDPPLRMARHGDD
jgi:capsular polysaccharide biosynthesis protein